MRKLCCGLLVALLLFCCSGCGNSDGKEVEKTEAPFTELENEIVTDGEVEAISPNDPDIENEEVLPQKMSAVDLAAALNEKIKDTDVSPFSSITFSATGVKTLVATITCYDTREVNLNRYQDEAYSFHIELIELYGTEDYVMELLFDYNFAGKHSLSRFINGAGVRVDDPRIAEEILGGPDTLGVIAERVEKEASEDWLEKLTADGGVERLFVEVCVSEEEYWANRESVRVYCIELRDKLEQEVADKGFSNASVEVDLVVGSSRYSFTKGAKEASFIYGYNEGSLDLDKIFEICRSIPMEAFEEYREFYNTYAAIDVDEFYYSGLNRADFQVTFVITENGYYYLLRGHQPYIDDKVRLQEQLIDIGCVDLLVKDMDAIYVVPHEATPEQPASYSFENYDTNFGIAIYQ